MRKLSIIFFAILTTLLIGLTVYVAVCPDFTEPVSLTSTSDDCGITEDSPVWKMTMDDFGQYLVDCGINDSTDYDLVSDGIATDARIYGSVEVYWWDLENLDENTAEYKAYMEMTNDGMIDLWSSGNMMPIAQHGPFGICTTTYEGDIDALLALFHKFGMEDSQQPRGLKDTRDSCGITAGSPVWDKTLDDLAEYLYEQGIISSTKYDEAAFEGTCDDCRYYPCGSYGELQISYWDVNSLTEGTSEYDCYYELLTEGTVTFYGTYTDPEEQHGPFSLWLGSYAGDMDHMLEVFHGFAVK